VTINGLVRWMIARGLGGFEAWAGTPGTVGGAIHGNAHYAGRLFGELVSSVLLLQRDGSVCDVPHREMAFGYDTSRVHGTGDIVLTAVLRVAPGCDPAALRAVARESLAHRKRTQPLHLRSAGCAFQNPDPEHDRLPAGMPWSSGALIDRAGLKGQAVGGASISLVHANFIVNRGGATAADVRALVEKCRSEVLAQFGVRLRDELVYLGQF
jgi:UDP-N-acetylmuramate dehydrogenase